MESKLGAGLLSIENRIAEKLTKQKLGMDLALAECCITDKVMVKFNDEFERKMSEEDKHSIKSFETLALRWECRRWRWWC